MYTSVVAIINLTHADLWTARRTTYVHVSDMAPVNKHSCKHCETALNCVSYIDFRSLVANCRGLWDVYVVNDANLVGHSKFPTAQS
jgi:hypothetical protein